MELYKIIATCTNYTGEGNPRTFDWIPENFEGVKVLQKFSWQNPMGYAPKFSVETMKAIESDKIWLDYVFFSYGMQSEVLISVYKLDVDGVNYVLLSDFAIDFDTYTQFSYYSEFALKSISVLDSYNLIKNTDINYIDTHTAILPDTKKYINYISLKKTIDETIEPNALTLFFEQNDEPKVYNSDSALYYSAKNVYEFNRTTSGTTTIAVAGSGIIDLTYVDTGLTMNVYVKLYKNDFNTPILTIHEEEIEGDGHNILTINHPKTKIEDTAYVDGDFYFIAITTSTETTEFYTCTGDFSLDLYVETEKNINKYDRSLRYTNAETLLNAFFDNNVTIEEPLKAVGVVSAAQIINKFNYISLKPKDFLNDFCIATGSLVNFLIDGSVEVKKINTYFPALLSKANAITVTNFKDVSISYDSELNFASVSAGMESKEYGVYPYFIDWNKVISFGQAGRNSSESLDLTLSKFRVDFSGIIDALQKISTKNNGASKEVYMFDPAFTVRGVDGSGTNEPYVYDAFTPRDIVENWHQFIKFCFNNYLHGLLPLTSDGGTPDNLIINGLSQLENVQFDEGYPKITPLKIELAALIDEIDFSKKILKINHEGAELYIFVTEAETTDSLNEQKIKGNLINFPEED